MNKLDEVLKVLYSKQSRDIAWNIVGEFECDDILQSLAMRLITNAENIREESLEAYVHQAIRFTSINYFRGKHGQDNKKFNSYRSDKQETKKPDFAVPSTTEQDIYNSQLKEAVNEAFKIGLDSLSVRERMLLKSRFSKTMKMEDIAKEYDVHVSNIYRRIYRAQKKLKDLTTYHFRHKINVEVPVQLIEFNLEGI